MESKDKIPPESLSWAIREIELACESERKRAEKPEDATYGVACYESALCGYKSLMQADHDEFSLQVTKGILNRLVDGKCLTPIEDTPGVWSDITGECNWKDGYQKYQCTRMSSLFKEIAPDGTVTYSDINRVQVVNVDNPDVAYTNGFVTRLIDKLAPITIPYFPADKKFKVVREEFLTDPKNGDFDTVAYLYVITPDGKKVELNGYFKDGENGMVRIDKAEYDERKARRVEKK